MCYKRIKTMKSMQKMSFLVVSSLWISSSTDAMSSNFVFNNQEMQLSSVYRQISDQENIDPNDSRPAKKRKIDEHYKEKRDSNPLLNFTMTEAEKILGNPENIVWYLSDKKKPFTRSDIKRTVGERLSKDNISYEKSTIRKIRKKVKAAARKIGKNQHGNHLYWKPIQNSQKYTENFLLPVIYSSESNTWKSAAREWEIIGYERVENDTCICGKEEIKDVYRIRNRLNGNELYPIGSSCVDKFESKEMTKDTDKFKKIYNKISSGKSKLKQSVNKGESIKFTARLFSEELINYLNKKEILSDRDRQFLLNMRGRRSRNSEQQERINKIIEDFIVPYISGISQDEKITIDRQMLE